MNHLIGHPSYDAQLENWVRWCRAEGMLKGYQCPIGRLYVREPDPEAPKEEIKLPIYEQDAMWFERLVLKCTKAYFEAFKLYHFNRIIVKGRVKFPKSLPQKLKEIGLAKSTYYHYVKQAERQIKERGGWE